VAVEIAFGRELLRVLFGLESDEGYQVMVVLVIGSVFMVMRQIYSDMLRGFGHPGIPTVSELILAVSLLTFSVLLWQRGLIGISWAVTLSALTSLLAIIVLGSFTKFYWPTRILTAYHGDDRQDREYDSL
jgi:O-antigen/teichoic acid export membrane protein